MTVFVDFSCEITEKGLKLKKRLKTAEKSTLTSFRVRAAPTSWSKDTTNVYCFFSLISLWFLNDDEINAFLTVNKQALNFTDEKPKVTKTSTAR